MKKELNYNPDNVENSVKADIVEEPNTTQPDGVCSFFNWPNDNFGKHLACWFLELGLPETPAALDVFVQVYELLRELILQDDCNDATNTEEEVPLNSVGKELAYYMYSIEIPETPAAKQVYAQVRSLMDELIVATGTRPRINAGRKFGPGELDEEIMDDEWLGLICGSGCGSSCSKPARDLAEVLLETQTHIKSRVYDRILNLMSTFERDLLRTTFERLWKSEHDRPYAK